MDVQFVFGNPVKGKKGKKGKRSMARHKKRGLSRNRKGQFVKRSKAKRRRSARNPDVVRYLKKVPKNKQFRKGASSYFVPRDVGTVKTQLAMINRKLQQMGPAYSVTKGAKGALRVKAKAGVKGLKNKKAALARAIVRLEAAVKADALRRQAKISAGFVEGKSDWKIPKIRTTKRRKAVKGKGKKKTKSAKSRKRSNPVAKKRGKHKRHHAKKRSRFLSGKSRLAALLKAATPKHPVRGKYKRKGRVARVSVSRSKYRRARNPIFGGDMIQSYLAHSASEAGGLLIGGALYGLAGSLIGKIPVLGPQLVSTFRKVPVVGPSLPTLFAGVVLAKIGERQGIPALRMVGKGLIGATVVGIGVNASQMIPGLGASGAPKLAGVDYTSLDGVDYTALGADVDGADFGSLGHDAQMGEQAYGELPDGLSGVDFTMGDGADFGELPAGLGEGQMG